MGWTFLQANISERPRFNWTMNASTKFKTLFFLLFFACSQSSTAISGQEEAFQKVDSLIALCRKNFFADPEFARSLAKEADLILKDYPEEKKIASIQNLYGITHDIQGNTDSSRHYFTRFYELSLELRDLVPP